MKKLIPIALLLLSMQWIPAANAQNTPPPPPECEDLDPDDVPPIFGDITCNVVRHCDDDQMSVVEVNRHWNKDKYRMPLHFALDPENMIASQQGYRPIKLLTLTGDVHHKYQPTDFDVELMTVFVSQDLFVFNVDFFVNANFANLDGQPLTYLGTQQVDIHREYTYFNPVVKNNHDELKIHTYNTADQLTVLKQPYPSADMDVRNVTLTVNDLSNQCGVQTPTHKNSQPYDIILEGTWVNTYSVTQ